jgi:hypothetical protein
MTTPDQERARAEEEQGPDWRLKSGRWSSDLIHRPPGGWKERDRAPARSWLTRRRLERVIHKPPLWVIGLLLALLVFLVAQLSMVVQLLMVAGS